VAAAAHGGAATVAVVGGVERRVGGSFALPVKALPAQQQAEEIFLGDEPEPV